MPKLLTQVLLLRPQSGRILIGMVAGFIPEGWPASGWNARPDNVGIRRQAIENLAKAFDDKASDAQVGREAEVTKLHAKIGQLVVERDFLAKAFDR